MPWSLAGEDYKLSAKYPEQGLVDAQIRKEKGLAD